ncbi:MAG: SET domain-containing protein [Verrucomicrobiales bacterium]|nr:SET domain-containing protein-lysine N-methyltransferase [Verrucomicrobiota bacterium JB025]
MGKKKSLLDRERKLYEKMRELWKRGQSELCEVRGSVIHGQGVYATQDIEKGTKIIEYVGERIDKEESNRRGIDLHEESLETGGAAVYIFTLDDDIDLDGNVPWNTARLINHSCNPNCEAWIEEDQIFIHALRDLKEGDELTFDYGFDVDCYEDHPCRCGEPECKGFIVSREQWPELERRLKKKQAKKSGKKAGKKAKA